ncbi:MAG: hypothetical protein D6737_08025, partial [Chloroflexi bacterium]
MNRQHQPKSQQAKPPQKSRTPDAPQQTLDHPRLNPDLTVTPDNILYLQRTIGNRAVQQLLKQQRPV